MRILLCSHVFAPSVGGIETVSGILAEQFARMGCVVTVVTNTPGSQVSSAYETVRRPSFQRLRKLAANSDIVLQSNISLRTLLPVISWRKPVVVAHHTWIARMDGRRAWQDHLKLVVLRACHNIAISKAVAASLPVESVVVGNPFEIGEFSEIEDSPRTKDLVFLGRLVSDKGCDLLLRALSILKTEGICPSLSIIGDGSERPFLQRQSAELGLASQIVFRGAIREGRGKEVAQHRIMVIPSRWAEPFGVVALEGIAAGCVIVASSSGGLPEAVGPCGLLFPNGDEAAMTSAIRELLVNPARLEELKGGRSAHLERFRPETIAKNYLEIFESALSGKDDFKGAR